MQRNIVLGATGGIGGELCRVLRGGKASVLAVGRDGEKLESLGTELGVETFQIADSSVESIEAAVRYGVKIFGRVDGIANCIGSVLLKPAHLTSIEDWENTLSTNLTSAFSAVRAAGKLMTEGGAVALVSSAASRVGLPNHEAIAAAKAGVEGLTRSAAASYAKRGLRVNCVAPGLVKTPATERITSNEKAAARSIAMHAAGRLGETGDIAGVLAYLLGPDSQWVTGQVFAIDGGLSSVRTGG